MDYAAGAAVHNESKSAFSHIKKAPHNEGQGSVHGDNMKELLAQLSVLFIMPQHRVNHLIAHNLNILVSVLYRLGDNAVITDGYVDATARA